MIGAFHFGDSAPYHFHDSERSMNTPMRSWSFSTRSDVRVYNVKENVIFDYDEYSRAKMNLFRLTLSDIIEQSNSANLYDLITVVRAIVRNWSE